MRKEIALFAVLAFAFSFIAFGAQAMPSAAALKGASNSGPVVQVRDGCGPHRYRGRHGHCHHF
jgi:hypothetical protein